MMVGRYDNTCLIEQTATKLQTFIIYKMVTLLWKCVRFLELD